ncbi:MAG: hypothetical protein SFU91_03325 [Chloroherpetonaceae bacterium]|nr:hypothetical protein [Chloroherpetonaceae bacterium]
MAVRASDASTGSISLTLRFAEIFSSIFHPITLPLANFGVLIFIRESAAPNRILQFFIVFLICTIAPAITVVLLKKVGLVNDYDISDRKKRSIPMAIGTVTYLFGAFLLWLSAADPIIVSLMILYGVTTFLILLISLLWKISVHVCSLGGPIASLGYVFGTPFFGLIILLPVLMWARVVLKAHTPLQTLAGAVLGFFGTYLWLTILGF